MLQAVRQYRRVTDDSTKPVWVWSEGDTVYWYSNAEKIYFPEDSSDWFCYNVYITDIDIKGWDTSNVTTMSFMFEGCEQLTSLDLSNFNTANVTTMSNMFDECKQLTSLDLSNFNTANVTDMSYMFMDCEQLTSLDLSNFNTANVDIIRFE